MAALICSAIQYYHISHLTIPVVRLGVVCLKKRAYLSVWLRVVCGFLGLSLGAVFEFVLLLRDWR